MFTSQCVFKRKVFVIQLLLYESSINSYNINSYERTTDRRNYQTNVWSYPIFRLSHKNINYKNQTTSIQTINTHSTENIGWVEIDTIMCECSSKFFVHCDQTMNPRPVWCMDEMFIQNRGLNRTYIIVLKDFKFRQYKVFLHCHYERRTHLSYSHIFVHKTYNSCRHIQTCKSFVNWATYTMYSINASLDITRFKKIKICLRLDFELPYKQIVFY